jgi:hypothetical protein
MSGSHEWFEFHLTPKGWIAGSEKLDAGLREKEIPEDRVLTLCFYERLSSPFSDLEKWYREKWRNTNEEVISDLTEQYGELPEAYRDSGYVKR